MTQPISPSITAEWLLCPTYGRLNRQWTPFSHWTPYFAMGHAIHTAIELILGGKEIGQAVLGAITRLSMEYEEQDEWPLDTLEALLKKGISAMMSKSGGLTQIMAQTSSSPITRTVSNSMHDISSVTWPSPRLTGSYGTTLSEHSKSTVVS